MSWEQRGNHRYYYQKRRVNGRVVSVYLGRGPAAQSAEQAVAERKAQRRKFQQHRRQLEQQDAWIELYCQQVELTIAAGLIAAGYHHHRGDLRRTATPGRPRTKSRRALEETDQVPLVRTEPLPIAASDPQALSEAVGQLRSAVSELGAVVEGVEIKNPKYLALLAKMKRVNPHCDSKSTAENSSTGTLSSERAAQQAAPLAPNASDSSAKNRPSFQSNRRRNGYQPSEAPPAEIRAGLARLNRALSHLHSSRGRYSSVSSRFRRARPSSTISATGPPSHGP